MATYKEIKGVTIQTLDSDPTVNVGAWASGGSLNQAKSQIGGVGTQTAAICIGGNTPPETANTETYDGSSWTEVNNLNTARRLTQGMGTVYTLALAVGGYTPPGYRDVVESWNGSSWTEITETNENKGTGGQAGTSTSGIAFAGVPGGPQALTEFWNGSTWTELADLNTARRNIGSAGTAYTAGLAIAGSSPTANVAVVEEFNGSSWTEISDLNQARQELAGAGTSTLALASGGTGPSTTGKTEAWNGSSWTEVADLATARREVNTQASNSSTSALVFGGTAPPYSALTEEFSFPSGPHLSEGQIFLSGGTTLKAFGKAAGIPSATWATGGNMNVSSHARGGAGHLNTAALAIGADPSPQGQTELYNGTSWTELNDLNVGRRYAATLGTTTLALAAGGANPGGYSAKAETWDGTNWTAITDINSTRGYFSGAGVYNSAIIMGGEPTDNESKVEVWDGSSWTEVSDFNTGVRQFARAGQSNAYPQWL